jgi:hypothetical protein
VTVTTVREAPAEFLNHRRIAVTGVSRTSSARVDGEIVIRRSVEEVFDYVADERNEPNFTARMSRVELLTP